MQPYIGYCRQQAGKYGLKGSRLGELLRVIEFLKQYDGSILLGTLPLSEVTLKSDYVHLDSTTYLGNKTNPEQKEQYLDVLGKKFQMNRKIKDVLSSLERMNEGYGERARMAKENDGVDWKAVSHAFRCCYQLIELAETRHITFPLAKAEEIKQIKTGQIPYVDLQEKLYELMEQAIKAVENSDLPKEPDVKFWNEFILDVYKHNL